MFIISLMALLMVLNPFTDITVGRCIDNAGNGKEYNGEPYYNYIKYEYYNYRTKQKQKEVTLWVV